MTRRYVDCATLAADARCSVTIAADHDEELIEAAVEHLVRVHGQADGPALHASVRQRVQAELPRDRDVAMNDLR